MPCLTKSTYGSTIFVAMAILMLMLGPALLVAQGTYAVIVEDASGAAIPGATVTDDAGKSLGTTNQAGMIDVPCATPCRVHLAAPGFEAQAFVLTAAATIKLQPSAQAEQITVTAYRAPLGELESPATTRQLSQQALEQSPAVTLDGKLRALPGVETFRRSPSLVANPSSQGISLRGLGSTSASRTLVTEDDVPLNDPLGSWIHWQEQPELAIQSIQLVRGGASDLYGSSAIGGVINVIPARPSGNGAEIGNSYGGEETFDESLLANAKRGPYGALIAGGVIGTDGYIQESPAQQGPVDQPSNVHSQNALIDIEREQAGLRLFLRGTGFQDSRHNGTPYQYNKTRLVRYATGADWKSAKSATAAVRLYGSRERFQQTFSSISNSGIFGIPTCTFRCGETPTKFSLVPDNELGAAAHWNQPLGVGLLVVAGADAHDVRVWDREQSYSNGVATTLTNLRDHQRDSAAYVEAMWMRGQWTATASARMDWFQNYDGQSLTLNGGVWVPSATQPTHRDERPFDPRLGVTRKLGQHWAASASGFRAFRSPSPNELYRTTTVGSQTTKPNYNLLSERAAGGEGGLASQRPWGTVRVSYFFTEVNRPIVAVASPPGSVTSYIRQNLGRIESRGVSLDYELKPLSWLFADSGYQFAHATVAHSSQDNGNWIPEVARNMATLNLRAYKPAWGTLSLESRLSGHMFDDDANTFYLHGYFRLDAYASHEFHQRYEVFASGENLLNRAIEVSKTPTTTLGQPRVARAGILIRLGHDNR
jgi:outer membrane receptor protein involved in Fe transport